MQLSQELRESLRRVAESQPLERARLAAAEAARHDRRECARLRAARSWFQNFLQNFFELWHF